MAGRGRSATLPAWMTAASDAGAAILQTQALPPPGVSVGNHHHGHDVALADKYVDADERVKEHSSSKKSSRSRGRSASKSRSRSRDRDRRHRRSPESKPSRGLWRPKKDRISNFDVRPPPGVEIPPIVGIVSGHDSGNIFHNNHQPNNSFNQHQHNSHMQTAGNSGHFGGSGDGNNSKKDTSPTTRHARRIYVGGIPPSTTEQDMSIYFNDLVARGLPASVLNPGESAVLSVYLNLDKCFAFVEFPSIALATSVTKLDGIQYTHRTGSYVLRIRRPHDYKAELVPATTSTAPPMDFKLPEFNIVNTTVTDGPGKVFVGGLPYHLTDEQVKELLSAFGPLKAFNLVRDPGSVTSKGYGFCEYYDSYTSNLAIQSLNDMEIGDKKLTVRIAEVKSNSSAGGASNYAAQILAPFSMQSLPNPLLASYTGTFGNVQGNQYAMPGYFPPQQQQQQQQQMMMPLIEGIPSNILKLENMVTPQDLIDDEEYEDIVQDVQGECNSYGRVAQVVIPRVKNGFAPYSEGLIFVEFTDIAGAAAAASNLAGRKFAEKIVIVSYYDPMKFQNRILQ